MKDPSIETGPIFPLDRGSRADATVNIYINDLVKRTTVA
jgi:hypothetical protein